ncbi:BamHI control element (fragment) [Nitrospira sp. ND1]|uniref:helix-turn-helix domain-containing protein n=1 Tax=Nitrospira sp. ND1 TaxID=1658518 RepID=UPI0009BC3056
MKARGSSKNNAKELFGYNVREIRRQAGLSQEELGYRAKLHRTYISSVERGKRNVSLENIFAIAAALEISPRDLLNPIVRKGTA